MGSNAVNLGSGTSKASGGGAVAIGYNCNASGWYSLAGGYGSTASGQYSSISFGQGTIASGKNSTAFGKSSNAVGEYTIACGFGSVANSQGSSAIGYGTVTNNSSANGKGMMAIGQGNVGKTDTLFEIGNGNYQGTRANVFEVFADGRIIAPQLTTITDVKSLVTKEYVAPKGGATASRPVDPELYTVYWDTTVGKQITCTDNTTSANVWNLADGTVA